MEGPTVGILALQGDSEAHRKMLGERLGAATRMVRTPEDLAQADALVIPGGESTTLAKLMERIGLDEAIRTRAGAGMPVYGTCAGMILLAQEVADRPNQPTLRLMDIAVERNAFGRQLESFEADVAFRTPGGPERLVRGVFIRAPYVVRSGCGVQELAEFRDNVVAVRQGRLLATAFHPELTDDPSVHEYFLQIVNEARK